MKIQYLVNWSFTYQCRMSSFTRDLSLPSSSTSLSCAVGLATYSAEAPRRMHQNSPFSDKKSKKISGEGQSPLPQWGGGHPLPTSHPPRRLRRSEPPTLKPWLRPCVGDFIGTQCSFTRHLTICRLGYINWLKHITNKSTWYFTRARLTSIHYELHLIYLKALTKCNLRQGWPCIMRSTVAHIYQLR